jgi:hypothetical protein
MLFNNGDCYRSTRAQFAHSLLIQSEIDEQLGTMKYSAVSRENEDIEVWLALKTRKEQIS